MISIINEELKLIDYKNQNGFPPTICIQLLNWCNLTCTYCRSNSTPFRKGELQFEQLKNLLVDLKKYGVWRVSLTGGEPFFWKDINKLLLLLSELDFYFSITTNGFATKKIFDTIKPIVWKKCTLYVSIDGDRETHNSFRGANSFENAISFLKYVRPKVNKLHVNTVLFTNPAKWAIVLYDTLEQIGVTNWTIISPVKKGRWGFSVDNEISFKDSYYQIQDIAKGKTTTTFLDFAETDSKLTDVVFIDSDGSIRLPGYFTNYNSNSKPLSTKIHLSDSDVTNKIVASVLNFINSEKYIL